MEMTRTELDVAMSDASSLMRWMVHLSLDAEALEEPAHLPAEAASTCAGCPYYRGTVRLCGPEGEALGYGARHVEGA